MDIRLIDLAALAKEVDGTIDINSREVLQDPETRRRLFNAKLIDEKGGLTEAGKKAVTTIRKREDGLIVGIPFTERVGRDQRRAYQESTEPWFFTVIGKDQIVTNGEMLFVGLPIPQMKAIRAGDEIKKMIPKVIQQCGGENFVEVWPHSYQAFSLGGIDLIWFSDDKQELMVPILAKYVDYISGRFLKATWWAKDEKTPIQVKVRSKGTKNGTVALIASFDIASELDVPKKQERWRENEMQSGDLSIMEEVEPTGGPI